MKNSNKFIKKFIGPGVLLLGLLFVSGYLFSFSFPNNLTKETESLFTTNKAYAFIPLGDTGGLPTLHYKVSTSEVNGAYGTISPYYISSILPGSTVNFNVVPVAGYKATASGCGGSLLSNTYTTGAINSNCTVTATYTKFLPTIISFNSNKNSVDMGTAPILTWQTTSGVVSCSVKGSDGYIFKNGKSSNKLGKTVGRIYTPTTYTLKCDTAVTSGLPTVNVCQGTVVGSIGSNGNVGPNEGYDCTYFKTQNTCLQGWVTHGCSWTSY